jgi:hypothetical protein
MGEVGDVVTGVESAVVGGKGISADAGIANEDEFSMDELTGRASMGGVKVAGTVGCWLEVGPIACRAASTLMGAAARSSGQSGSAGGASNAGSFCAFDGSVAANLIEVGAIDCARSGAVAPAASAQSRARRSHGIAVLNIMRVRAEERIR